ncbi:heat shock protein 9/12-domain-containing protein [Pyronema domesticum]|uniref:Similar to Heat shock protein hsp9 acc. no. P50519 n=1 Tax=Pyronema omphalodes (strain CBS 100304) TaxID=1076935 RepID=U4LUR2_PYROM|nr:heat shock protein 9/12-domain-containing protein [Pyronema domesticum]CCX31871.1 Similar to Heat shock protein hsp9; acc. no. P50519 [Pyronema omphalodes CBS 100304]
MSDSLRKPFSDCVFEKMTPDSSKSTIDKAKENITTTADRAVGEMQPDSSKSSTQEGFDKSRHEKDTIVDKTKNAIGMN